MGTMSNLDGITAKEEFLAKAFEANGLLARVDNLMRDALLALRHVDEPDIVQDLVPVLVAKLAAARYGCLMSGELLLEMLATERRESPPSKGWKQQYAIGPVGDWEWRDAAIAEIVRSLYGLVALTCAYVLAAGWSGSAAAWAGWLLAAAGSLFALRFLMWAMALRPATGDRETVHSVRATALFALMSLYTVLVLGAGNAASEHFCTYMLTVLVVLHAAVTRAPWEGRR